MQRVDLAGKGQALDGDLTTTGATCIASGRRYSANYRHALCKGDSTSECPVCGQAGIIAEGRHERGRDPWRNRLRAR